MIDSNTASMANHIRREMKKSGYKSGVWSAALKTAYRYDLLVDMPNKYEKKIWSFIRNWTRRCMIRLDWLEALRVRFIA